MCRYVGKTPAGGNLIGMIACIAILHLVGWFTLIAIVVPRHLAVGTKAFGLSVGITAYLLGMRHAFDADHIAAIDNTTRRLVRTDKRSSSVGFWFSLGHSSVVFGLTLLFAFGIRSVAQPILDRNSTLHHVAGLIGPIVSAGFLYLVAALNIVVLLDVWKVLHRVRASGHPEAAAGTRFETGGMMTRLLGRVMVLIDEPWQMYFIGMLFGLGFDTATEVALLALTGSGAASHVPWYAILCLPILFAAGMSLLDTIDGSVMSRAYDWALVNPAPKIRYNFIITTISVGAALIIGTAQIAGLLNDRLVPSGRIWKWMADIDLSSSGFVIAGILLATWLAAIGIRKWGRIEG